MAENATITASAPGSLMLLGEHAVLHGHRALVCAINRRITVRLAVLQNDSVEIVSSLGGYKSELTELVDDPAFRFVLEAVRAHIEALPGGFRLEIESEFSADIGFGSSAAVTVATHAVLMRWIEDKELDATQLFFHALETVHVVQGRGSGADLAATIFGGIVAYKTDHEFQVLELSAPLTAVYCGYKTPTPEVIRKVELLREGAAEKYDRIYTEIDASVDEAVAKLSEGDLTSFGKIMTRNQQLMDEMGVNTPELKEIVEALGGEKQIVGAKISGSGMGDCVVGIGIAELNELDYPVYHLEITPTGCAYHD